MRFSMNKILELTIASEVGLMVKTIVFNYQLDQQINYETIFDNLIGRGQVHNENWSGCNRWTPFIARWKYLCIYVIFYICGEWTKYKLLISNIGVSEVRNYPICQLLAFLRFVFLYAGSIFQSSHRRGLYQQMGVFQSCPIQFNAK